MGVYQSTMDKFYSIISNRGGGGVRGLFPVLYCIVKNSVKGRNRTKDGTRSNREYILNESEGDLSGRLSVKQGSAAPFGGPGALEQEKRLSAKTWTHCVSLPFP